MNPEQARTGIRLSAMRVMPLKKAWFLYADNGNSFVTEHDVAQSPDGPVIGEARPATVDGVRKALASIDQTKLSAEFLQSELLCASPGLTVWWRPATVKRAFLKRVNDKKGGSIDLPMPPLLYAVRDKQFMIFALKRKSRPQANDKLYIAPLFNVFGASGEVCMGNVTAPNTCSPSAISEWEKSFWHSTFTHANAQKLITRKGGLEAYWNACRKGGLDRFESHWLVPTGLTVEKLIRAERPSRA